MNWCDHGSWRDIILGSSYMLVSCDFDSVWKSENLYFYMHKYIFLGEIIQIRLVRLIPFKRHLNRLNGKQRVADCLAFSV